MRLRAVELIVALALLAAPLAAEAQQAANVPRIGLLDLGSLAARASLWEAFRQGMREVGSVEGRTVIFVARGADAKYERLPALAAEFVRLKVDAIVTAGGGAAQEGRQATATIPIVMASGDPLAGGLVASLARPGGNITGLFDSQPRAHREAAGAAQGDGAWDRPGDRSLEPHTASSPQHVERGGDSG